MHYVLCCFFAESRLYLLVIKFVCVENYVIFYVRVDLLPQSTFTWHGVPTQKDTLRAGAYQEVHHVRLQLRFSGFLESRAINAIS